MHRQREATAPRKKEEALKKAARSEQAKVDKQLEKVNRKRGKNSGRDVMAGKSQVCISVAAPAFLLLRLAAVPALEAPVWLT